MTENPLESGVRAGASKLKAELTAIDLQTQKTPPLGQRRLTRNEKYMSSLATPAREWTPDQTEFVLNEMRRRRKAT